MYSRGVFSARARVCVCVCSLHAAHLGDLQDVLRWHFEANADAAQRILWAARFDLGHPKSAVRGSVAVYSRLRIPTWCSNLDDPHTRCIAADKSNSTRSRLHSNGTSAPPRLGRVGNRDVDFCGRSRDVDMVPAIFPSKEWITMQPRLLFFPPPGHASYRQGILHTKPIVAADLDLLPRLLARCSVYIWPACQHHRPIGEDKTGFRKSATRSEHAV